MAEPSPLPEPASLEVLIYPAPVLRKVARAVQRIDAQLAAIAERMIELMVEHEGVGLAGPQVGLPLRLFVMSPSGEADDARVVINPEIIARGRSRDTLVEGCLSLPEIRGKIERPVTITWRYQDLEGTVHEERLTGFPARVAQHEFDHLEGILITDRMRPAERRRAERQLLELAARSRAGLERETPASSG
ncbi:MAG: peptide deformylase [Planctomycetota bacterium]|nr:MAG: peptide deformylase [Planctomycetota bacterium]